MVLIIQLVESSKVHGQNLIKLSFLSQNKYENLFRLIFETQIRIHIHIRYFKSLPTAIYYLTTSHIKNLYRHSKTYNMGLKQNLYLTSLFRRGPINTSTPTFPNINLTETKTILIVASKFNQKQQQESLFPP